MATRLHLFQSSRFKVLRVAFAATEAAAAVAQRAQVARRICPLLDRVCRLPKDQRPPILGEPPAPLVLQLGQQRVGMSRLLLIARTVPLTPRIGLPRTILTNLVATSRACILRARGMEAKRPETPGLGLGSLRVLLVLLGLGLLPRRLRDSARERPVIRPAIFRTLPDIIRQQASEL